MGYFGTCSVSDCCRYAPVPLAEIDRALKKVTEGVELFDAIYDKMQASNNQPQKEKLETELKSQIKKLQRQRDTIKSWVSNNDVKDKAPLLEARRVIEQVSFDLSSMKLMISSCVCSKWRSSKLARRR